MENGLLQAGLVMAVQVGEAPMAEVTVVAVEINLKEVQMIITTTETIPNKEIVEVLGVVTGNIVQSKHIGRDVMAGLKTLVGGEIRGYTEMLTESRNIALERILESAKEKGADAVVGVRFTTSSVMERSAEIMAFGTAVKLKDIA